VVGTPAVGEPADIQGGGNREGHRTSHSDPSHRGVVGSRQGSHCGDGRHQNLRSVRHHGQGRRPRLPGPSPSGKDRRR
jgi:hypothetical protein